jgi:hypothetical protein
MLLSRKEFDSPTVVLGCDICSRPTKRVEFSTQNFNMGNNTGPIHNAADPTKLVKEFSVFGNDNKKIGTQAYKKMTQQLKKVTELTEANRKL